MAAPRKGSAFDRLDAMISPEAVANIPKVATFHQFLVEVMRVKLMTIAGAGTYGPYTFKGRAALEGVVHLIDHILGSKTGKPLKDAKLALAGGAQFGKTTLELALAAYCAACRFLSPIIYLPDDGIAEAIVDAKFRPDVLDQIPWIAQMTKVGRAVNESGKAVNTKGAFLVTDGKKTSVGMFRGLQKPPTSFSADVVIEDEKDDIKPAMAKFASGRMTNSAMRFHLEIGTQRIHGAGQNKVWENGTQGVTLVATKAVRDALDEARFIKTFGEHRYVLEVPPGFINPEEAWPQICRLAVTGTPRTDDPRLGLEGDFRHAATPDVVVAAYRPGLMFYYAHPETGELLDCERPLWHHRVPAKIAMQLFSLRMAQIGTPAIDLQQIVAHWVRAVGDAEEMVSFCCDRKAMPKSAAQSLTPAILTRARDVGAYVLGDKREAARFAGLDMGDRCWFVARDVASAADKRIVHAAQIAIGDVVARVPALFAAHGISTLCIDERPAVSEARTLCLILNGLADLEVWPSVDWKSREAHVSLPSGLVWNGRDQQWTGLRCAVVRFTKNQLGAGIEQGAVEFQENGVTKFVPVIACNRFETIDRVVREFLTPAENVVEVVKDATGKGFIRQDPAMRMPSRSPGAPSILETLDAHFLAGSQRAKDAKTHELGDYVDGIDNHFLFANGYSALAETVGSMAQSIPSGAFTAADLAAVVLGQANGAAFHRPLIRFS